MNYFMQELNKLPPTEKRQAWAWCSWRLGEIYASQQRKKIAEARTKIELGIESEDNYET